jgi:hypothetical protein
MLHQGEGLALSLEPGHDCPGVHAELDELKGDAPAQGFLLFREINDATTPFADFLEQLVTTNAVARFFGRKRLPEGFHGSIRQKRLGRLMGVQQRFDPLAHGRTTAASGIKVLD